MPSTKKERRNYLRMDKVFPVQVESPEFGFTNCIARNISGGGIFLESKELLPLGSTIKILFSVPGVCGGITAVGEVKNQFCLNFGGDDSPSSMVGMGIRFLHFEDDGMARLSDSLTSAVHIQ